jgi:hypothetical protein
MLKATTGASTHPGHIVFKHKNKHYISFYAPVFVVMSLYLHFLVARLLLGPSKPLLGDFTNKISAIIRAPEA